MEGKPTIGFRAIATETIGQLRGKKRFTGTDVMRTFMCAVCEVRC